MKLFVKELTFMIHVELILLILIDDVQGNIESLLCNSDILLVKGKLIGLIPKLDKEFLVSFDVYPNKFVKVWQSVIHFTIDSDKSQYGDRVPGIWFHDNGSGSLYISAPINGDADSFFVTNPIKLNEWSNVKVSQILRNTSYVYTIRLNGEVVFTCINNQVQIFANVKVYASDPWHDAQDGLLRNLFIINGNDLQPIVVLPADIEECANLTDYGDWANIDCVNTNGSCYFTCKCVAHYSIYCNWESDCLNTNGNFYFTCKSGWRLNNNSCVDVDECANLTDYCNWENSDCVNTNGSYYCTCKSGWRLNNNSCVDFNECNELAKYCNLTNSDCVNTNGSYNCTCKSGWLLENNSCVDVNECNELAKYCNLTNSDCVNTNGSYNCICKSGWILENNSCVDVNECNELAKYCNLTNSDCVNTNGSYNCFCKSGWILENNSCVDVNECNELAKYCNLTNSDCVNTYGSYNCTCKSGWILENNSCVDVDECNGLAEYCSLTSSECVNTNGSYNCICKPGWKFENNSCVDINECDSLIDICYSTNNVCVNSIGSYYCYKGEWGTWSECSVTCGSGYKYSTLNGKFKSQQEAKRSLLCMNKKCSVDGNWSNWTTYESCSNSCGICFTRQERYCNNPAPADSGHGCFGSNVQYLENNTICRVNGNWTQWSSWSLCSQPCQSGVKTRYRSCSNPLPKYGGLPCYGQNADEVTCYLNKCKNVTLNFGIIFTDEVYIAQYSNPSDEVYKPLGEKIKSAIQNLYNKFNKTVPFNLKLYSIKNGKDYQMKP
ncbi:hemicentin-1-like [Hydra vulgaris]|uniref:Hemicentin-1-like n=1 Tax=Hydra vulgaris TaxID=6087 RepID=A0ABM4DKS3_HYDVU